MEDDGEGKWSVVGIASWKKFAVVSLARKEREPRRKGDQTALPESPALTLLLQLSANDQLSTPYLHAQMHLSVASKGLLTWPPTVQKTQTRQILQAGLISASVNVAYVANTPVCRCHDATKMSDEWVVPSWTAPWSGLVWSGLSGEQSAFAALPVPRRER
jgi:hypothetical protein